MQGPSGTKEIAARELEIGEQKPNGGNGAAAKSEISDGRNCASLMPKSDGVHNVTTSVEILDSAGLTIALESKVSVGTQGNRVKNSVTNG